MLSLDNAFSEQDILDFDRRARERLDVDAIEYSAEPKIDGLAITLRYERGGWSRRRRAAMARAARMSRSTCAPSVRFRSSCAAGIRRRCWRRGARSS